MLDTSDVALRLRQQVILSDFGVRALREDSLTTLLQLATELCADGMGARFCKALEYQPGLNLFLVVAGVGWGEGVVGQATLGTDLASPAGYALKTAQAVITNHLSADTRFRTPQLMADYGIRRAVNVIIANRDGDYGVLEVDETREGAFDEADTAFMQGFANLLGVAIERQRSEARLKAALERQELLAREMSHRVKNGLSVVRGVLALQARASTNEEVRRALGDAQARVDAIAKVHDQLWRQPEIGMVDLGDFVGSLCEGLRENAPSCTITCQVDEVTIEADRAIPIGLFLTELVTNAVKYAYPEAGGEIRIEGIATGSGAILLRVADDGIGLPPGFDPAAATSSSLGMRIVRNLARQLGSELRVVPTARGATFEAALPGTA